MNKYKIKLGSKTLILFVLGLFLIQTSSILFLQPNKVYAAPSEAELRSKAVKLQKLEAFRKCVELQLNTDGINKGSGPFNSNFATAGSRNVRVGHIVDSEDGKWDCDSGNSRLDAFFKLLLRNGKDNEYYGGWNTEPYSYTHPNAGNIKDVVGDNNEQLYFINRNNDANYDLSKKNDALTGATGGPAKGKVNDQINNSITKLLSGLDKGSDERKTMRYLNLSESFVKGCGAKKITNANAAAGDTVRIGDTVYTVNDDGANVSVGYGELGTGDGDLSCNNIAEQMKNTYDAYSRVTGSKDQIPTTTQSSGSNAGSGGGDSCESKSGVSGWFACPILETLGTALNWVDKQINSLMFIKPNQYKENNELYNAWASFRNIALSLLVAAMLVIVISTALDLSFLDAYTVKKAFPRLVASIIFILLSWWVCVFLIDLTNTIGQGLLGIMTSPFNIETLPELFTVGAGDTAAQYTLFGGAIFGILFIQGAVGIVGTWIGAALLVMGIAFITLVARQLFIITLILFAPLAILAWIFPGSAKAWKFWWESFTKVLLMYPMVMALIGAGRIFSSAVPDEASLVNTILKFTAFVIPYAFIPFTFKAAGRLFGNLAGMVNDRSRGGFDRLRKRRQQGMAQIGRNAKTGDFLRGTTGGRVNPMGRLNAGVARASTGAQGRFGFGERGSKARALNMATFGAEAAKDPRMSQFLVSDGDGATVMGLSGGNAAGGRQAVQDLINGQMQSWQMDNPGATPDQIRDQRRTLEQRYERAYQSAAAMGFSVSNATAALSNMGANKGYGLATGDLNSLNQGVQRLGGGDTVQESLMGAAQYSLRGAGRLDVGGSLGDRSRDNTNAGPDQRRALMDSIEKTGFSSEVALSPHATKQVQRTAVDDAARFDAGTLSPEEATQTAVMVSEAVTGLQYGATGEARDNIVDMVNGLGLVNPTDGRPITINDDPELIQEAIANRFGHSTGWGSRYQTINFGNQKRTGGPTTTSTTSDKRLKKDIIYVGSTHSGIRLYRFRYLWSEIEYVGVMAQELIHTHPDAVMKDAWGYYKVDYAKLDLKFMTYDEWRKEPMTIKELKKTQTTE